MSSLHGPPLLAVRDLDVSYGGDLRALHDVSLHVPSNGVVALLGNNGAGKSTLLRAISGTLGERDGSVDGGSVVFESEDVTRLEPGEIVRRGIVQVPEGRCVFGRMTVADNLRAGGLSVRDRRAREAARGRVLELFPILGERSSQRAALLSGGEQQMLAIGRALMAGPRMLLLDEPSLGLAPKLIEQIGEIVLEIVRQGTAVLLVEQNAAMALSIADLAFVLETGTVTLEGTARELAGDPGVRDRYLGIAAEPRSARPDVAWTAAPLTEVRASAPTKGLAVDDLCVRFGGVNALSGVSFEVDPGEIHALVGPNGAGKSSCLNVISGIYRATSGAVRYGDRDLTRLCAHEIARAGVARTFQNISLSDECSVYDNLLLGRHRLMRAGYLATAMRLPHARREELEHGRQVRVVAELVRIDHQLDREVRALSYGDRKRVELARAICAEPRLLLLDEPVAGMTLNESLAMADVIADVRDRLGVTIVVVEHDMTFVMGLADRITVLDFGRCIADGTPVDVQRDPEVLRAYLGTSATRDASQRAFAVPEPGGTR